MKLTVQLYSFSGNIALFVKSGTHDFDFLSFFSLLPLKYHLLLLHYRLYTVPFCFFSLEV